MKRTGILIQKNRTIPNNREIYDKYINDIKIYKTLSRVEEFDCFEKLRAGYVSMRDKIIRHNLLFVVSAAKHYQNAVFVGALTLEDLIAEGNIALCIALDKFDHNKGFKFISFAVFDIKQYMLNMIQKYVKTIYIPRTKQTETYKIGLLESHMEQQTGESVNTYNLAQRAVEMGLILDTADAVSYVDRLRHDSKFTVSLSVPLNNDTESTLIDTLTNSNATSPDNDIIATEMNDNFNRMMMLIPPHIRLMIEQNYGIGIPEPLTYGEIGLLHDMSASRIGQIIKHNIYKIRNRVKSHQRSSIF